MQLEAERGKDDSHGAQDSTYLDFSLQDDVCIARIGKTKYSTKLFHGEVANVTNFELWGLSRDR